MGAAASVDHPLPKHAKPHKKKGKQSKEHRKKPHDDRKKPPKAAEKYTADDEEEVEDDGSGDDLSVDEPKATDTGTSNTNRKDNKTDYTDDSKSRASNSSAKGRKTNNGNELDEKASPKTSVRSVGQKPLLRIQASFSTDQSNDKADDTMATNIAAKPAESNDSHDADDNDRLEELRSEYMAPELKKALTGLGSSHRLSKKEMFQLASPSPGQQSDSFFSPSQKEVRVTSQSIKNLRDLLPSPQKHQDHPAAWLWKHPDWTICMDDHGNTYYYNYTTEESTWDPPADLEALELPQTELNVIVTVPDGVQEGEIFTVIMNEIPVEIMCPVDCPPGTVLTLTCPSQTAYEVDPNAAEAETSNAQYDSEFPDAQYVEEYDDDNFAYTEAPAYNSVEEVPDDTVWSTLATVAEVDYSVLQQDAQRALQVIQEVSYGVYSVELIFQVSWAYKFNLLRAAAKDCFFVGGDFFDSSPYDNCDGTPRYDKAGFVQWLEDLQTQRQELVTKLIEAGGNIDEDTLHSSAIYQHTKLDYANLELLALAGNEANLIKGMIDRRKQVNQELENLRARMLAIVSVEGGPSRESLDVVFTLMKESLHPEEAGDNALENEEMEEEVSNQLQERHKFLVDVIVNMVLLEDEFDSLSAQIDSFQRVKSSSVDQSESRKVTSAAEESPVEVPDVSASAKLKNDIDVKSQLLTQQYENENEKLMAELAAGKEAALRALRDRLQKLRAGRISELVAAGFPVDEATAIALKEMEEEEAEESKLIELQFELDKEELAIKLESQILMNQLLIQQEKEFKECETKLMTKRNEEVQNIKAKFEEMRTRRMAELEGDINLRLSEGTLDAAGAKVLKESMLNEVAEQEQSEIDLLDKSMKDDLRAFNERALQKLRDEANAESERLQNELRALKERRLRRLEERLMGRKQRVETRVREQFEALMQHKTDEEKENIDQEAQIAELVASAHTMLELDHKEAQNKIEETFIESTRAAHETVVKVLRSQHQKEVDRLTDDLQAQKERKKRILKQKLEAQKARRAKEIMQQNPDTTLTMAVALAQAELSEVEEAENNKIDSETESALRDTRKAVLENLMTLYNEENDALKGNMEAKEKLQRDNLQLRLQKRRHQKERELMAAAAKAANDSVMKVSLEEQKKMVRDQLDKEMQLEQDMEAKLLNEELSSLKDEYAVHAEKLESELNWRKANKDKKLQDRLAMRKQHKKNAEAAGVTKESNGGTFEVDLYANADKSGKDEEKDQVEIPAGDTHLEFYVSVNDYINNSKQDQKYLLSRLKRLIQSVKTTLLREMENAMRSQSNKEEKDNVIADLAHLTILFEQMNENLLTGLKKKFLYELKFVKEYAKQNGSKTAFTREDITMIEEKANANRCCEDATQKIVDRYKRDMTSMLETQLLEKQNKMKELKSSGCSDQKLSETAKMVDETHMEQLSNDLTKALITIAGVWVDTEILVEKPADAGPAERKKKNPSLDSVDEDWEREASGLLHTTTSNSKAIDNLFRDDSVSISVANTGGRFDQRFGTKIFNWCEGLVALVQKYNYSPFTLFYDLEASTSKINENTVLESPIYMAQRDLKMQMQKPLFVMLVNAFKSQMRRNSVEIFGVEKDLKNPVELFKPAIQLAYDDSEVCLELKEVFNNVTGPDKELLQDIIPAYRSAIDEYIKNPAMTRIELKEAHEKLMQAKIMARNAASSAAILKMLNKERVETLIHALESTISKRKKDMAEEYKRNKQQKGWVADQDAEVKPDDKIKAKLAKLNKAFREMTTLLRSAVIEGNVLKLGINLEEIDAEGLVAAIDKKLSDDVAITLELVTEAQKEVEAVRAAKKEEEEVKKVIQKASESHQQLDVQLKLDKAKQHQALQNRLLNRNKNKNPMSPMSPTANAWT